MNGADGDAEPVASDYTTADGYDSEQGINKCPRCDVVYSANGGYFETVYDETGRSYASIYETDPMDGPFFCRECWRVLDANERRQSHRTLREFERGNGDGGGE